MTKISPTSVNFYPPLIQDYLDGKLKKNGTVGWDYSLDTILEKADARRFSNRQHLVEALKQQYKDIELSNTSASNLNALLNDKCFTVCTGHQLSIFAGPAYFVSKIIDTIRLAEQLNDQITSFQFVPVFWLASEDHDFEEISKFTYFKQQYKWEQQSKGPVGKLNPADLIDITTALSEEFAKSDSTEKLAAIFQEAYAKESLTDATKIIVNALFGEHGLIIIDGDDKKLKQLFAPVMEKELKSSFVRTAVEEGNHKLEKYKTQAHAREINLFYLTKTSRERIIYSEIGYSTANGDKSWTSEELFSLLKSSPESFSPNVLMRPVYQETILPNIAYTGGAGEIAYWLQLPQVFKDADVDFPVPVVRNSYLYFSAKEWQLLERLNLEASDLFKETHELEKSFLDTLQSKKSDISAEISEIDAVFDQIKAKASEIQTDLQRSIEGERQKALKSLQNTQNKLEKAEKRLHEEQINKIRRAQRIVFPEGSFQERKTSFFEFQQKSENSLIDIVKGHCTPFENSLKVIVY